MVTIAQAQTQVRSARLELKEAQTSAEKRQAEIKLAKAQSHQRFQRQTGGTISEQLRIAGQVGRGAVRAEIRRRRVTARKELKTTKGKISIVREELGTFRTQLTAREREIKGVESQIREQREFERDVKVAQGIVDRGLSSTFAPRKIRVLVRKIEAGERIFKERTTQIKALRETGLLTPGATLLPTLTVEGLEKLPIEKLQKLETVGLISFKERKITPFDIFPTGSIKDFITPRFTPGVTVSPFLTVEPVGRLPFGRGGVTQAFGVITTRIETKGLRRDITIPERFLGGGVALASVFVEAPRRFFELGKGLVTEPIETIKGLPGGFRARAREITTKIKSPTPGIGFGLLAGEILLFKGLSKAPKIVVRGTDIFRTFKLKELPTETIIAPEFFKGQPFPKIKKGQTAGELLAEFKPVLPGELKPAGFTATPRPFLLESKIAFTLKGTSELPGVFQAPLVSPRFLRISSEEARFFGLSPFETFRPSIVRITPEAIRLAPGISLTQRIVQPQRVRELRQFFETVPRGKAFVPFIKTEKEAIIPFGTKLKLTQQRFFIKFEGRRVPIFEFKTVGGIETQIGKLPTIQDISVSISRSRVGRKAKVTPFEVGISSRILERISSRGFLPSSRDLGISISKFTSPLPSRITTPPPSRITTPPPSRIVFPSIGKQGVLTPFDISFEDPFKDFAKRIRKIGEKKPKKKKPKKRPGFQIRLAPSFTAIVQELRGLFPKEIQFGKIKLGISPAKIRVLPRRRKGN